MQTQPSLLARDDTFFGVCQGIGEDLGFNPVWLRLALTGLLFLYPLAALGLYAGLGLVVVLSRRLFPALRVTAPIDAADPATDTDIVVDQYPLPLAA